MGRSAVAHLEGSNKRRLRDFDLGELTHPLLALFLLFEELSLAGHVAAIAFGEHVLAQRLDRFPRDDPPADRRLNRHLKELARYQVFESLAQRTAWLRWTMIDSASTGSLFTKMFIRTRSPVL